MGAWHLLSQFGLPATCCWDSEHDHVGGLMPCMQCVESLNAKYGIGWCYFYLGHRRNTLHMKVWLNVPFGSPPVAVWLTVTNWVLAWCSSVTIVLWPGWLMSMTQTSCIPEAYSPNCWQFKAGLVADCSQHCSFRCPDDVLWFVGIVCLFTVRLLFD